jgi:hypothetical protein
VPVARHRCLESSPQVCVESSSFGTTEHDMCQVSEGSSERATGDLFVECLANAAELPDEDRSRAR